MVVVLSKRSEGRVIMFQDRMNSRYEIQIQGRGEIQSKILYGYCMDMVWIIILTLGDHGAELKFPHPSIECRD